MVTVIDRFDGDFAWLSNFYHYEVEVDGKTYMTNEHYFQACKAVTEVGHENIRTCPTPGEAKKYGRMVTCRSDWEKVKEDVMLKGLRAKFEAGSPLAAKLLTTGSAELVEGNTWNDCYWGVSKGQGLNRLGHLLMRVRHEVSHNS